MMVVEAEYNTVLLVRAPPGTAAAARALEMAGDGAPAGPVLIFFHGEGVRVVAHEQAARWRDLAVRGVCRLALCATALQRRNLMPAAAFERESLALFWRHAATADRVAGFAGDD